MNKRMLERLTSATLQGVALAALTMCGPTVEGPEGETLDAYPEAELGCSGPNHEGGYWGQCCVSALCYTPHDGVCAPPDDVRDKLAGFPPGSGGCACGVDGPYAPTTATDEGDCCYLVGEIGCDGRPLLVEGTPRVAAVVRRADWGSMG